MKKVTVTSNTGRESDKFMLRFPDGMRERVAEAAKTNGRSMNAEIIQRLEHSFTPWEERPWEERMVTDIDRAMLATLTEKERNALLDRVKGSGGAETINRMPNNIKLPENFHRSWAGHLSQPENRDDLESLLAVVENMIRRSMPESETEVITDKSVIIKNLSPAPATKRISRTRKPQK